MAEIEWKESYALGIRLIDEQHKRFIDIINKFSEVARNEGPDGNQVFSVICDLLDYARLHFCVEEEVMKIYGWENHIDHIKIHSDFVEKINKLKDEYEIIGPEGIIEMSDFLNTWLVDHILKEDQKMGPYLKEQGLA